MYLSYLLERKKGQLMKSYEDAILECQESEREDCATCEFACAEKCKNQCMEIHVTYNPNLRR